MTIEPIKEPKTLWDYVNSSQWEPLFAEIKRIKENKPKLRLQRARKDIVLNVEEIEEISRKAINLNIALFKRKKGTSKSLGKKLKKIENFSEKYLNRLVNIPVNEEPETPATKKLKIELFITKMRYDALKAYFEKILAEANNGSRRRSWNFILRIFQKC